MRGMATILCYQYRVKLIAHLIAVLGITATCVATDNITILTNLAYKSGAALSDYERERCVLDLYLPTNHAFATLVWFHGGGLVGGSKEGNGAFGRMFVKEGIALAMANYRLSPKVKYPAYVEDAAAAFAWVHSHIVEYGGNSNRVFVGGHSAGSYLTALIGMNPHYLETHNLDHTAIAGLLPFSGQMLTHFTVCAERGFATNNIIADDAAPIFYTHAEVPPMLIVMGDHDFPARVEENQYFIAAQKVAGNKNIRFLQIPNRNHSGLISKIPQANDPVCKAMLKFIRSNSRD